MWNGIIQWFGVKDEKDLNVVLPNRKSFTNLYTETELYFDRQDTNINCEGYGDIVSCIPADPDSLTDDGWDHSYYFDDDDYGPSDQNKGVSVEHVDDKKSNPSILVTVIMVTLCSFLLVVGAFIYDGRTGKISKLHASLAIWWCRAREEKWTTVDENVSFEVVENKRGNIRIIPHVD
jgi:hypothetical protein